MTNEDEDGDGDEDVDHGNADKVEDINDDGRLWVVWLRDRLI